MSTALAPQGAIVLEQALVNGDLASLTPAQRLDLYRATCQSLGLNELTKPFEYLRLNGKLVLYAKRDCTDQLRQLRGVSVSIVARERHEDVYVVTARAVTKDGRTDESIGAVPLGGLRGDALANALMKAETKAKRRVTLSICGLGLLDESEASSIPQAQTVSVEQMHAAPVPALPPAENGEPAADAPGADADDPDWVVALQDLMAETRTDKAKVLEYYGVARLGALTPDQRAHLTDRLQAKPTQAAR